VLCYFHYLFLYTHHYIERRKWKKIQMSETYESLDYIKYVWMNLEYSSIFLHIACVSVLLTRHQNFETESTLLTRKLLRHSQSFLPTSFLRGSCFIFDASISNFNVDSDCLILLRKIITSVIDIAEIKVAVRNIRL